MSALEGTRSLGDYASLVRRRWKYPVLIVPAGVLIAVFIAYVLPVAYQATGSIIQESSLLPAKLVPTTVTGDESPDVTASEQLELSRRRVMKKESLIELIKRNDPYPDDSDLSVADKASLIDQNTEVAIIDPVTYAARESSSAFSISYSNPSPELAARITNELIQLFITYNRRTRSEQAEEALKFLQSQARQLEDEMQGMEHRLAQFKAKYGNALPEAQGRNLVGADRSQRDLDDYERDIRAAEEKESLLALQLSQTSPSLIASVNDWRKQLAQLRADLAEAETKYTPEHPDVKRLRRAIADLAAQGAAGDAAQITHPDNPEYLVIKSQLDAARRDLEALRANATRARADLLTYEQNLATSPNVEREYVQLDREYTNAQARYSDLQSKIKAAALAQNLESEARGERFAKLRSALVPTRPSSPNRLGIMLIGLVLSGGLALALAVIMDSSDPTVRGTEDLQAIVETTPIGAVPLIFNRADIRRRRLIGFSVAAVYLIATALVTLQVVSAN
jgi:protein tyrosine kinase modulator